MAGTLTVANSAILLTTESTLSAGPAPARLRRRRCVRFRERRERRIRHGHRRQALGRFRVQRNPLTITLQADSPSLSLFEQTYQYEVSNRTKLAQNVTITLPAVSKRYELKSGFMRRYKAPSGKKILQPVCGRVRVRALAGQRAVRHARAARPALSFFTPP